MRRWVGIAALVALVIAGWGWLRLGAPPTVPMSDPRGAERVVPDAPPAVSTLPHAAPARAARKDAAREPSRPAAPAAPEDPLAWVDAEGAPSRALVRASLERALRDRLPMHKLSPTEVDRLTDAAVDLRRSQEALRALPATPENADERRALRDAIGQASETFVTLLDMTPAEFTEAAEPDASVHAFDPDEPIPEPEFLEPPR